MSSTRLNVVQVIPIYYRTDEPANTVFSQHQDTLKAVFSGRPLILAIEEPQNAPAASEVARTPVSERFPGLTHSDIPCLWIEAAGQHFFWRLHRHTGEEIHNVFRALRDAVNDAKTLKEVEETMKRKTEQTTQTGPKHWLQNLITLIVILAVMLGSFALLEITKAIAFAFVVLIVAPVIMAFTQGAQTIQGKGLIEIYTLGLQQAGLALKSIPKLFSRASGPADNGPPDAEK